MADVCCKSCGQKAYLKNGFVRGLQRHRCKARGMPADVEVVMLDEMHHFLKKVGKIMDLASI